MKLVTVFNLLEAAVGGRIPVVQTADTVEAACQLILTNCSDSKWMFQPGFGPIWRGHKSDLIQNPTAVAGVVNPGATERVSQNTTNQYTVFFDNHPERAKWPKRSRSLICSTRKGTAAEYGRGSGGVYAIIPFNGTPIGAINSLDMWDTKLRYPDVGKDVADFNFMWSQLFPQTNTWSDWVRVSENTNGEVTAALAKLKRTDDPLTNDVAGLIERYGLLGAIEFLYSNDNLFPQHTLHTPKTMVDVDGEVWLSSQCVAIPARHWDEVAEAIQTNKYK